MVSLVGWLLSVSQTSVICRVGYRRANVGNREVMRLVVYDMNWRLKQSKYAGWNDAVVVSMLQKR